MCVRNCPPPRDKKKQGGTVSSPPSPATCMTKWQIFLHRFFPILPLRPPPPGPPPHGPMAEPDTVPIGGRCDPYFESESQSLFAWGWYSVSIVPSNFLLWGLM